MDKKTSREIAEFLSGSCASEHDAAEHFEVTSDEVLEAAVNEGIENCAACGWWHELEEMSVDGNDYICPDCSGETDGDEDAD